MRRVEGVNRLQSVANGTGKHAWHLEPALAGHSMDKQRPPFLACEVVSEATQLFLL